MAVGDRGEEDEGGQDDQVRPNVGYATPDNGNVLPPFTPSRPPGTHFERAIMRGAMTTELKFFRLFITTEMIDAITSHTNSYAHAKVGTRGYTTGYVNQDGSWVETSPEEIDRLVALLVYMGLVKIDSVEKYPLPRSLGEEDSFSGPIQSPYGFFACSRLC